MRSRRNKRTKSKHNNTLHIIEICVIILIIIAVIMLIQQQSSKKNKSDNTGTLSTSSDEISNSSDENKLATGTSENSETTSEQKEPEEEKDITFTMAVTGDIMCHNTMYMDAYNSSTKTYDFSYMFDDVKYYLQTADITVGNLETTFAGSKVGYSGYPTFNTPEILATNLKKVGFDVVSTANNHCMDKGYSGLVSTLKYLDEADLSHTGTYSSKEDQQEILIKNVKGVKIAFLSFTYGTNGIPVPSDKSYAVNLIDEDLILEQLKLAKAEDPDLICVCMHWGTEYQTTPNSTQTKLADLLFKNGADIILGNHPHVIQKMEKKTIKLEDGSTKDGFVVYSLGNFMANQKKQYTCDSAILNLTITKNAKTGKISIDKAEYTPTYIYNSKSGSTKKFKILDIENTIAAYDAGVDTSISKTTYNTLTTELKNVKKLLGDEIK